MFIKYLHVFVLAYFKNLISNVKHWLFSILDMEYILQVLHKVHGYKITPVQGLEFFNDLRDAECSPAV